MSRHSIITNVILWPAFFAIWLWLLRETILVTESWLPIIPWLALTIAIFAKATASFADRPRNEAWTNDDFEAYALTPDGWVCRLQELDGPHTRWVTILDGPEQSVRRWYATKNLVPLIARDDGPGPIDMPGTSATANRNGIRY